MRLNTQLIMTASAFLLAMAGISLTFLPEEIAGYINADFATTPPLVFQIIGALYFAFAMLNWMARGSVMGGIYNRPITIANFTHFFIGGLALIKIVSKESNYSTALLILVAAYILFALLFGVILYTNPVNRQPS